MRWLSKGAEKLVERASGPLPQVGVLVVGSGYGGAVAALRLAQAGQEVVVLERGDEYVAGEFPNDLSQAGKHVRAEVGGTEGVSAMGYENALFDFRLGLRAGALVGNGLGGGSLINAAVGLRPDARVFRQDGWPAALRNENMAPWFERAEQMLEVTVPAESKAHSPAPGLDLRQTEKYLRLEELARAARAAARGEDENVEVTFEDAPLAIQMRGVPSQTLGPRSNCIGCGDCVTGCNYDAKLSLTKTYLPAAYEAGAEFFTGITVLTVLYDDSQSRDFPWVVSFVRTAERKLRHDIKAAGNGGNDGWIYRLRARNVVLAAGTFGSTEILLRSRHAGLRLSQTALGMGVSGNGDDVSFAYNLKEDANAVGCGSGQMPDNPVGPTISGIVRFHDTADVTRSSLTQDGSVPGLMSGVFHELLTTLGAIAQLDRWRYDQRDGGDPLALNQAALRRSMTLLGMGHDSAGGVIVYDAERDRVGWGWPGAAAETAPELHKQRMSAVQDLGGIHLQNPAGSVLPDGVANLLTGPKIGGAVFTVHPLGGCRMGESALDGVVNHWGAVFREGKHLHEGLFVLDGSIVPASLGANPMLTITALAERACSKIVMSLRMCDLARAKQVLPEHPASPSPLRVSKEAKAGALLSEVLRGQVKLAGDIGDLANGDEVNAALFVQMKVGDWQELYADEGHRAAVPASAGSEAYAAPRLVLQAGPNTHALVLEVQQGGWVELFCPVPDGWFARAGRFLRLGLTYLAARWLPDHAKSGHAGEAPKRTLRQWYGFIRSALKSLAHATEVRGFNYSLPLKHGEDTYQLTGTKRINGAASWASLGRWLRARLQGKWPTPERRSLWEQLMALDVELRRDGKLVFSGRLNMDLQDMMRRMAPQLAAQRDMLNALHELAGYPLLILRGLIKTRLLDFRAPDYCKDLPDTDPALISRPPGSFELDADENQFPPLPTESRGDVPAQEPVKLEVRYSHRAPKTKEIRIGLIRYKQDKVEWLADPQHGTHKAKAIILINGFAQSTRAFVAPELGKKSLAAMLYDEGWDVWMLEYRVSPLLDASARYSTMDDIAAFDIPAAVEHVACAVARENGQVDPALTQVFVFSHCVGSASLAMSILGGWLRLPGRPPRVGPRDPDEPEINRIAGASFSQFLPFSIGSETAQQRLQLASFLRNVLQLEMLNFAAGTAKADLVHSVLDRVFASFPYAGQECPHEQDLREHQPDSTTCKRMAGLLSRLFNHSQLLPETHKKLDWYFGRTNLGVFLHGAKCVEYERLVNVEGHNTYVNDRKLQRRLHMPVLLLQGQENVLFDSESLSHTVGQLHRVFGKPGTGGYPQVSHMLVPGHAHFDCTIGWQAPTKIFPGVIDFFEKSFAGPPGRPGGADRFRARLPMTGPIVGWIRPDVQGETVVRVWIELDPSTSDRPYAAVTLVSYTLQGVPAKTAKVWNYWTQQLDAGDAADLRDAGEFNGRMLETCFAVADVKLPADARDVVIKMFGVHFYKGPGVTTTASPGNERPQYPSAWGSPMEEKEVGTESEPFFPPAATMAMTHGDAPNGGVPAGQPAQDAPYEFPPFAEADPNSHVREHDDQLGADEAKKVLDVLRLSLEWDEWVARRARPGTLSRQARQMRSISECELHLSAATLFGSGPGQLEFLAAGCRHPGVTDFERDRADLSLGKLADCPHSDTAEFMLMLGDQIYADARAGVFDVASPIERLLPRYRNAFGSPGFREVAAKLPLYMVVDDHEINDGWTMECREAGDVQRSLADNAGVLFRSFQRAHGPDYQPNLPPCLERDNNYKVERSGFPFFVLDTRFSRSFRPGQLLHPGVWPLLEEWLRSEQAKGSHPKFIVSGSVFAPGVRGGNATPAERSTDSWQDFPKERQRLLAFLRKEQIDNVVFISSDYHCSAAAEISWDHPEHRAWAIVAPPLHAPMRFANTDFAELLPEELIPIDMGAHARVQLRPDCGGNGEGWLRCRIEQGVGPAGGKCWTLYLDYQLTDLDEGTASGSNHTIFMQ